ncbi:hypothetical protein [Helicobacter felis]|uniref:Uncharacterized protein n=3 Tax=Helicobacter felis TaxID=214 RepID=E7A8R5_HELFC|nr:hypothetical protein [Helicobacter felis]CBY82402.1 predicted protein [Helicobacter felis ATCC 49179]
MDFYFRCNDSMFMPKQDETKHGIKFFTGENHATDYCCDAIIFKFNQKEGNISVYLCEIKSSPNAKKLKQEQLLKTQL